jgi:hypothetical protein
LRGNQPAVLDIQVDPLAVPPQLKSRAQAVGKAFAAQTGA